MSPAISLLAYRLPSPNTADTYAVSLSLYFPHGGQGQRQRAHSGYARRAWAAAAPPLTPHAPRSTMKCLRYGAIADRACSGRVRPISLSSRPSLHPTRTHTRAHTRTRTHARTHTHTCTKTRTHITACASVGTQKATPQNVSPAALLGRHTTLPASPPHAALPPSSERRLETVDERGPHHGGLLVHARVNAHTTRGGGGRRGSLGIGALHQLSRANRIEAAGLLER